MQLSDLANFIYFEIGNPISPSQNDIIFVLKNLCGELNNLISTQYKIIDNEFFPELGDNESAILRHLYLLRHYKQLITQNQGAAAYDWSELTEGDSSIRRVSKNEISKTYMQLRTTLQTDLYRMISFYKSNRFFARKYN